MKLLEVTCLVSVVIQELYFEFGEFFGERSSNFVLIFKTGYYSEMEAVEYFS